MAQTNEVPITAEGLAKLEAELEQLVSVKRPALSARIKAAREHGDLKENAEYHDAKNDQAFMETKIQQLEFRIRNARVIEDAPTDEVGIGSTVCVYNADMDEEATYIVTGPAEADPLENKVSAESPIGSALMGAKPGASVEVQLPRGTMSLTVGSIG